MDFNAARVAFEDLQTPVARHESYLDGEPQGRLDLRFRCGRGEDLFRTLLSVGMASVSLPDIKATPERVFQGLPESDGRAEILLAFYKAVMVSGCAGGRVQAL